MGRIERPPARTGCRRRCRTGRQRRPGEGIAPWCSRRETGAASGRVSGRAWAQARPWGRRRRCRSRPAGPSGAAWHRRRAESPRAAPPRPRRRCRSRPGRRSRPRYGTLVASRGMAGSSGARGWIGRDRGWPLRTDGGPGRAGVPPGAAGAAREGTGVNTTLVGLATSEALRMASSAAAIAVPFG